MRTARIEMAGKERLLCFSTGVVETVCEKYGDTDKLFEALEKGSQLSRLRTVIWLLAQLMEGGARYAKLRGIPNPPPLSEEDIRDLCDLSELANLRAKIMETITNGSERQVEADPPKNAEATPAEEEASAP